MIIFCGHFVICVASLFRSFIYKISTKHHTIQYWSIHSLHPEAYRDPIELHCLQPHQNMLHPPIPNPRKRSEPSIQCHVSRVLPLDPRGFEAMGPHRHNARHGGEGKGNCKFQVGDFEG